MLSLLRSTLGTFRSSPLSVRPLLSVPLTAFKPLACSATLGTATTQVSSRVLCRHFTYSSTLSKDNASREHIKQAKTVASRQTEVLPERLLIYHAGTGRVTFLAMFKVTCLFVGAFFCFAVAPAYYSADKLELGPESLGPLCGLISVLIITYITGPFVTHMHIQLPAAARVSRQALERFVRNMPPSTPLVVTTMSIIGKPRYSKLEAGHLRSARSRFGLINYVRDHIDQENTARKWYNFRAVSKFYVQDDEAVATARRKSKVTRSPVEWWIWDAIRGKLSKRAASASAKRHGPS